MKKKAFTLIELLCTISILLISLSFITFDYISMYNKKYTNLSIETIISDLQEAKLLAINNAAYDIGIYFYLSEDGYNYDGYKVQMIGSSNSLIKTRKFKDNLVISRSKSTIPYDGRLIFRANGSVSPYAATIAVYDKDTKQYRYITLTIGYTRIMEVPSKNWKIKDLHW